ncbi:MAG: sigma factor-like helix-turn-helix DNA-binding protein [Oscillospiraceae bacterium]|nr:sigma factor-like helix-turn-helix DNA-binding protein [Oscillospiraceae bacterium]
MPKNLKMAPLIELYAGVLTDKQREVIELYYFEDLSLAEIAEHSGITRQGVRDAIKRGETIITELESQLGFLKRQNESARAFEEIRAQAKEILLLNDKLNYSDRIALAADKIVGVVDSME